MTPINYDIITKCQSALDKRGYAIYKIDDLQDLSNEINSEKYQEIDNYFQKETKCGGLIFKILSQFCHFNEIEFIISLRDAKNEWEEDGIWHDDGSRKLAFSLSLTTKNLEGGILEIRKKDKTNHVYLKTPQYGEMIIFKTGVDDYEHKINSVTKGKRLIIAGWCS